MPSKHEVGKDAGAPMTTTNIREKIPNPIDDEAAYWVSRKLSGSFSDEDQRQLDDWLAASKRHLEAFDAYMTIAEDSTIAGALSGVTTPANDMGYAHKHSPQRFYWSASAIAASIFAAVFFVAPSFQPTAAPQDFATMRGQTQAVDLSDGTQISLNADSAVSVTMTNQRRTAELLRGEAFFNVARDEERPFVVSAANMRTMVLGTSFSIRTDKKDSLVSVHSGVVSVRAVDAINAEDGFTLQAGERISVSNAGQFTPIVKFDVATADTWRDGYLVFDQTPLADVVADLNRYYEKQLVVENPDLNSTPVSGRIEIKNQEIALRTLSTALSLDIEPRGSSTLVLRAYD